MIDCNNTPTNSMSSVRKISLWVLQVFLHQTHYMSLDLANARQYPHILPNKDYPSMSLKSSKKETKYESQSNACAYLHICTSSLSIACLKCHWMPLVSPLVASSAAWPMSPCRQRWASWNWARTSPASAAFCLDSVPCCPMLSLSTQKQHGTALESNQKDRPDIDV